MTTLQLVLVGALTLQLGLAVQPAWSQANNSAADTAASTGAVDLNTALRKLKLSSTRTQRALMNIINDVGQTTMSVDPGDPRFFDPTDHQITKNPQFWEKDFSRFGPLMQPHKKWVDSDMEHLKDWISTLQTDATAITLSNPNAAATKAWDAMNAELKDIGTHMQALESLTIKPPYDNLAIAKAALAINDDLKDFDKQWKVLTRETGSK